MTKYAVVTKGFFLDSKFQVQALIPINYLHIVGKPFISLLEDPWGNMNSFTRKVNVMLQRKKWGPSRLKLGKMPSSSHICLSFLTLNMQMMYSNQKRNPFLSWLATLIFLPHQLVSNPDQNPAIQRLETFYKTRCQMHNRKRNYFCIQLTKTSEHEIRTFVVRCKKSAQDLF